MARKFYEIQVVVYDCDDEQEAYDTLYETLSNCHIPDSYYVINPRHEIDELEMLDL